MALKWAVGYCALVVFQQFILPVSPMVIATSFTIFATYTRRMFPCLMTGALMLTCTPLRYLIVGLRQLHIPQKLIVAEHQHQQQSNQGQFQPEGMGAKRDQVRRDQQPESGPWVKDPLFRFHLTPNRLSQSACGTWLGR